MRHEATLTLGGFDWSVRIIGSLAIISKPSKFPTELPVNWETNGTIQVPLREPPPRPIFGFAIIVWHRRFVEAAESAVRRFIRREILVHWNRERALQKKRESRSRAPQRRRAHRRLRACR